MQPYIFPYIGYFHLIEASDSFVFYDDVTFIKQGWINRNSILFEGERKIFTIPVSKASSFTLIKDTRTCISDKWIKKFHGLIRQAYGNAPYFQSVLELLHEFTDLNTDSVSDLAIESISSVYRYLGEDFTAKKASDFASASRGSARVHRLCEITKMLGHSAYVNLSGGASLYNRHDFKKLNVDLSFVKSHDITYPQFGGPFIPKLSILDVLMFNSISATKDLLKEYSVL